MTGIREKGTAGPWAVLRGGLGAPVPWWLLLAVLAVPYAWYGFTLGATFWIDGFCYAGLGSTLSDPAAYRAFNSGYGRLALSHLQIGLPALGWLLERFPTDWQWPLLQIFQRTLSLGSVFACLMALSAGVPRFIHLLTGLLIAGNPFLQGFHNAFMTESISGSLLLLGFALSVGLFRADRREGRFLAGLGMAIFCVTQFRSYYGVIIFAMAGASLLLGRRPGRWLGIGGLFLATVLSGIFYPACRWVATGDWFLPGVGVNRLLVATYINPKPGPEIAAEIQKFSVPEREVMRGITDPPTVFGAEEAKRLVLLMLESGMAEKEIDTKLQALGTTILTERPEFLLKRLRLGLAASGLVNTSCFWSDGVVLQRGMASADYRRHIRNVFAWHSWLSDEDYRLAFASFFATPRTTYPATEAGQEWIRRTQEAYVHAPMARGFRDPLGFGRIPPDIWAWLGLLSAVGLIARQNIAGILILGAVFANFLVAFAVPVGNPRYCYGIFPFYFLACGAMGALWLRLPEGDDLRFSLRGILADGRRFFRRGRA